MIRNFEKVFLYMVADQVGDRGEAGLMVREEWNRPISQIVILQSAVTFRASLENTQG